LRGRLGTNPFVNFFIIWFGSFPVNQCPPPYPRVVVNEHPIFVYTDPVVGFLCMLNYVNCYTLLCTKSQSSLFLVYHMSWKFDRWIRHSGKFVEW
jgi:hypothetical protein